MGGIVFSMPPTFMNSFSVLLTAVLHRVKISDSAGAHLFLSSPLVLGYNILEC